jgi:hypothetical protein
MLIKAAEQETRSFKSILI